MRIAAKPTEQEIIEGPQAVSFQIANGNVRQRCILQTELPTKALAQKYLLANWSVIEKMARDALAAGNLEDDQIKRVIDCAVYHQRQFVIAVAVMLNDRETTLSA